MAHKVTTQVKKAMNDNLNWQYELFRLHERETMQAMETRFSAIVNEIYFLGEVIPTGKTIRKMLSVLPESQESKVEAIIEAKDLGTMTMDQRMGTLLTYELKKNQEKELNNKRKDKYLVLKATEKEEFKEENIALISKKFQQVLRRGTGG